MKIKCEFCGKEYSKKGIATHIWRSHGEGKDHKPGNGFTKRTQSKPWNKGLTKETDERVKNNSEQVSKSLIGKSRTPLSETHKKSIKESMKVAHKEGRAWNIGKSRWNNEPSYPEQFFMKVIDNEFNDKNYETEYPVSIYSIDFAWIDKKLAIEIDGQQHEKPDYKMRDKRKDEYLLDNGWKVLRIKWEDMFHEPKKYIEIAKKFIEE